MVSDASFPCVSSLGKIFLYLLLVLAAGALAAPQAWHVIQLLPSDWLHGLIGHVQGMPFHRYLSRSLQIAAIVLLWPLLRSLRIRSLRELGLQGGGYPVTDCLIGVGAGLPCIILLEFSSLWIGSYGLFPSWQANFLHGLPHTLLTAVCVAVIEEFLFRGVLLGFLRQMTTPAFAIILSAILFSGVHFLNLPAASAAQAVPHWWTGLAFLGSLGSSIPSWPDCGWAFATLFFAGVILAWMTIRTGSLMAAIGLHGVWIFGQQTFNLAATYLALPPDRFLPLSGPSQCNGMVPLGLLPLASLVLAGVLAAFLLRHRKKPVFTA